MSYQPRTLFVSLFVSFLVPLAAGCASDGRTGTQSGAICERYLDCLDAIADSGGAAAVAYKSTLEQARSQYAAGGACDATAQTRAQCDLGCHSGLEGAGQAFPQLTVCAPSAATTPPTATGPVALEQACQAYLSCLVELSPSSYAAALTLYGEKAACWDSPQQAANCQSACVAELEERKEQCWCTGSTCHAYFDVSQGQYNSTISPPSSNLCPGFQPSGTVRIETRSMGFQVDGAIRATDSWGPYTIPYQAIAVQSGNSGTITWSSEGRSIHSPFTLTADDQLEAEVDWYGDGDCVYGIRFVKL